MYFRSILRHYSKFIRPHLVGHVVILAGYLLGQLAVIVAAPLIYKEIIDTVTNPGAGAYEYLNLLLILLVITIVFLNIAFRIADYVITTVQNATLKEVADYTLDQLESHSYAFFTNSFTGGLVAKARRFVNAFETLHDQFVFQIWMGGAALVSSITVLFFSSPTLGSIFLGWLALYLLLVYFMVKWQVPKSLKNAEADSFSTAHLSDIITNVLTVKMFGTGKREKSEYAKTTAKQAKYRGTAWLQEGFWNGMFQAVSIGIFNIVILWAAVHLWKEGAISAGTIVLVQVYVITSFNVVWVISKNVIRISAALTDANEMVEIFDQSREVTDPTHPRAASFTGGHVMFSDVTFSYGDTVNVFGNLTLDIQPGERVALVGHSGAGKTTLVKLLLRFADITGGTISIDKQDITQVTQDDLRQHIAYVPQEPVLFHRTLAENIAYGKPDATRKEIEEAAKRARAHDFISRLPDGYDTLVGERGVKLSGGERQRVAIARAMLKDAPVLILDEATSSLDSVSEAYIQAAFEELMAGRTTIVIAHRLSTIQRMDRIIVLDQGRVAEQGTHTELLAQKGIYAELWESQVGGFITE